MKHIYHPIVGDTKYGRGEHNRFFREKFNSHRLLLHSTHIAFKHPATKEQIEIFAPFPEEFTRVLKEVDLLCLFV